MYVCFSCICGKDYIIQTGVTVQSMKKKNEFQMASVETQTHSIHIWDFTFPISGQSLQHQLSLNVDMKMNTKSDKCKVMCKEQK